MLTVEVRNRVVGMTTSEPAIPTVALDLPDEKITVSTLISKTITEQIERMLADLGYDLQRTQQALDRRYLTQAQIDEQAGNGKIGLPGLSRPDRLSRINKANEVKKAQQAFASGTYLIVADGQQAVSLDEVLTLKPDSKVTFIRMTPLVGG